MFTFYDVTTTCIWLVIILGGGGGGGLDWLKSSFIFQIMDESKKIQRFTTNRSSVKTEIPEKNCAQNFTIRVYFNNVNVFYFTCNWHRTEFESPLITPKNNNVLTKQNLIWVPMGAINNTSNSGGREWKHIFDHRDPAQARTQGIKNR